MDKFIRTTLIDSDKLKDFLLVSENPFELQELYDQTILPFFGDHACIQATNNTLYELAKIIFIEWDDYKCHANVLGIDARCDDDRVLYLMGCLDDYCCFSFYRARGVKR